MKVRLLLGLLSVTTFGIVGCEEGGGEQPAAPQPAAPVEPTPAPAPAPAPVEVAPGDVCKQLTEAAKAADDAKIATLISGGVEALAGEGVKEAFVKHWGGATCGDAKIDGDKAAVAVTFADAKAADEIAFVKAEGWKLDTASYLAKHPAAAGKKGKGKAKKAKGKKGK